MSVVWKPTLPVRRIRFGYQGNVVSVSLIWEIMWNVFAPILLFVHVRCSFGSVGLFKLSSPLLCRYSPSDSSCSLCLRSTASPLPSSSSGLHAPLLRLPFIWRSGLPSSSIFLLTAPSVFSRFPSVSSFIIFHCFRVSRNLVPSRF